MTLRRAVSFACLGGIMMLGAWVYVRAQAPRRAAAARANPGADFAPSTFQPTPPPPPRFVHPAPGTNIVPASATARPSLAPADIRPADQVPARVELTSGLVLSGTLAAEPLACQAAFGPVSIPLATIRGVRLHDTESAAEEPAADHPTAETGTTAPPSTDFAPLPASPEASLPGSSFGTFPPSSVTPVPQAASGTIPPSLSGTTPVGPAATVILTNGDSLTVALQAELLQLKTDWGVASIEVSHIRSILLLDKSEAGEGTGEATHEWQQHDGRWQLVRLEDAPAEAHAEETSPPALEGLPALPQYDPDAIDSAVPNLTPPADSTSEVQPRADERPSLPPPQLSEPTESPDAGKTNAVPSLEQT